MTTTKIITTTRTSRLHWAKTITTTTRRISSSSFSHDDDNDDLDLQYYYDEARDIRTRFGHDAACPYYRRILVELNPNDRTAGTHIAASWSTNERHEKACCCCFGGGNDDDDDVQQPLNKNKILKAREEILLRNQYSHENVEKFFGVTSSTTTTFKKTTNPLISCQGPLFVNPVPPGSVTTSNYPPLLLAQQQGGLACLIAMFLLSLTVPIKFLEQALGDSDDEDDDDSSSSTDVIQLMQELGWAFPSEINPSLMVPYVHIFPIDFYNHNNNNDNNNSNNITTMFLVTDLHPRVSSTVSMGKQQQHQNSSNNKNGNGSGNAVMYIGPDSLALAQHFDKYLHLCRTKAAAATTTNILDLGTGSGIQALSALQHWKIACCIDDDDDDDYCGSSSSSQQHHHQQQQRIKIVAVDINPRAIRFTKFNSILNKLDGEHLSLIEADLLEEEKENLTNNNEEEQQVTTRQGQQQQQQLSKLEQHFQQIHHHQQQQRSSSNNNYKNHEDDEDNSDTLMFDVILANPPFLPVPAIGCESDNDNVSSSSSEEEEEEVVETHDDNSMIQQRYGLYSSGGPSGEDILQRIVEIASNKLRVGGMLAVVSEFFVRQTTTTKQNDPIQFERLKRWWGKKRCASSSSGGGGHQLGSSGSSQTSAKGILFLNEYPIDAKIYAERRADNAKEIAIWYRHLQSLNVTSASPGLLYILRTTTRGTTEEEELYDSDYGEDTSSSSSSSSSLDLNIVSVPRTQSGSIWTPSNQDAILFTKETLKEELGWPPLQ